MASRSGRLSMALVSRSGGWAARSAAVARAATSAWPAGVTVASPASSAWRAPKACPQQPFGGAAGAGQPGQQQAGRAFRAQAQRHEGQAQRGAFADVHEIAVLQQRDADADGIALDGRDDRDIGRRRAQEAHRGAVARAALGLEIAQVVAGGEVLAGAGQMTADTDASADARASCSVSAA